MSLSSKMAFIACTSDHSFTIFWPHICWYSVVFGWIVQIYATAYISLHLVNIFDLNFHHFLIFIHLNKRELSLWASLGTLPCNAMPCNDLGHPHGRLSELFIISLSLILLFSFTILLCLFPAFLAQKPSESLFHCYLINMLQELLGVGWCFFSYVVNAVKIMWGQKDNIAIMLIDFYWVRSRWLKLNG